MGRTGFQWKALFGGCLAQVEDVPSPNTSPERKKVNKQTSFTRSHSDISKSTNPDDISSPEKKVNKLMSFTRMSYSDISKSTNPNDISSSVSNLQKFSLAELKVICQNFTTSNYLGEGGFGTVFKGLIDEKIKPGLKAQVVAVKVLDLEGMQGHKEWLMEVILLGQMTHPNLVKLIGYCYEEKHRVLVYEYMTRRSLENHLFKSYFSPLQWKTRVQIAVGAAKGLEFLHGANPQVIYRDFKASNILLDSDYKAKLSDFGLAKDGPEGDDTHVSTRVMGTQGYAAPEYIMTGHLTARSDVYSFGVVLLELLTGKRSFDKKRPNREQNLVDWTKSSLNDPRRLSRIMDQSLEGQYSTKGAGKLAALAYQCLSHTPKHRPDMTTVVETLEPLLEYNDIPLGTFVFTVVEENAGKGSTDKGEDTVNAGKEENSVKTSSEESDGRSPSGENRQKQQQRLSHNHRHRTPSPKSANYTDMVLHRKSPRHRNPKGV